jgi:outer membrane cobalamin receptor
MFILKANYVGTRTDGEYNDDLGPYGAEGSQLLGDYTLLGASVAYEVIPNGAIMLRAENILNTQYYEILGYTTLGRAFYINLRYNF